MLLYSTCSFDRQSRYRSFHRTQKSWLLALLVQPMLSEYLDPASHQPQHIPGKIREMPPWTAFCKDRVSITRALMYTSSTDSISPCGIVSSTCLFTSDVSSNELAIDRSCGASSKLSGSFPAWVCWYSQMASSSVTSALSGNDI